MERQISETRNSPARVVTNLFKAPAEFLVKNAPWLDPNYETLAAAAITLGSVAKTTLRNLRGEVDITKAVPESKAEAVILAVAQALDGFDGTHARKMNELTEDEILFEEITGVDLPEKHNSAVGGLLDTLNDRWGAGVMGISRIIVAHQRGHRYGELAAVLATLTNPWPSYYRARGESRFEVFPETGGNIFESAGTQFGRTILGTISTLYPNINFEVAERKIPIPFQAFADTITTAANITTAIKRRRGGTVVNWPDRNDFEEGRKGDRKYRKAVIKTNKIQSDGILKSPWLLRAAVITAVAVVATELVIHRKK